jgi:3-(3-hydroxy-phenyl)propionate hydroxylase
LTDLLEPRFNALCFTEKGAIPKGFGPLERTLQASGIPFRLVALTRERPSHGSPFVAWDHTGRLFPMYGATPGTVYLVRPDGHVLARWRHATPENVDSAIERTLHTSSSQSKESA